MITSSFSGRAAWGEATIISYTATEKTTLYFAIVVQNNATSAYTRVLKNNVEIGRVTSPGANRHGSGILFTDTNIGDSISVITWGDSDQHVTYTSCVVFTI